MGCPGIYIILHNLRSAYNVGSIFRTADAAGVSKIYLAGYTPAPVDRFGRVRKDFVKVSLGAEKTVAWERVASASALIRKLQKKGARVIAVEQSRGAVDYRKIKARGKTAFLFGNEVRGVPPALLKLCDLVAEIPMRGKKESLNVAVAVGIVLFSTLTE